MIFKNKIYIILSKWEYPFGGGEEFLFQTMQWAHDLGMSSYWLCFTDSKNNNFNEFKIDNHKYGKILKIPGGLNDTVLYNWLKLLQPDFVHHQGHERILFYNVCHRLRINFISGIHFWNGCIDLNPATNNKDILQHKEKHNTSVELKYLIDKQDCYLYSVSPFVSECITKITGYEIKDHIYPSSSYERYKIEDYDIKKAKYVTMINIHELKGGNILLYLLKTCINIPFLCIKTEHYSDDLDKMIEDEINKRNSSKNQHCILMGRTDDMADVYRQTRILLIPSLVDETFCRVANEAMMNGIPIITTGKGNISNLIDDAGVILDSYDLTSWSNNIKKLYFRDNLLLEYSEKSLLQYDKYSESKAYNQFIDVIHKIIINSKEMNIMIFTPWCDQGLGIQSRNYADILLANSYNVYIFGIKPYNSNSSIELQKNPREWNKYTVYYSSNDREHIKDDEIESFVEKYNIGKCIIPETCWNRVFEIAQLLRELDVKCYAIPNIEIVRRDEIFKHRYFYKILCNNFLCKNILDRYDLQNTTYIGYGIKDDITYKSKNMTNPLKFLFIGGMNAFSRKNILLVCSAFSKAYIHIKNIKLTCTIQKLNSLENNEDISRYIDHPGIDIIQHHLSYKEIIEMYQDNHISIQVSKQEGLGLGFYEALLTGTPILTLDTQPHNEIVRDNMNGWTIPCIYKKMTDNTDPLIDSAYFEPQVLCDKIVEITNNMDNYQNVLSALSIDYDKRLHHKHFVKRFIDALE